MKSNVNDRPDRHPHVQTFEPMEPRLLLSGKGIGKGLVPEPIAPPELLSLSLSETTINEGGSTELSGTIGDLDVGQTHVAQIDWGDGSDVETLILGPGANDFSRAHTYEDDDPTATPSDTYTINVTLTDVDGEDTGSIDVTVNNVAPQIQSITLGAATIDEDGTATVSGTFGDVGTLDAHTAEIDWGDGTTSAATVDSAAGTFSGQHQYLDDDPTATPSDTYSITVTVTDDDTGSDTATAPILTVDNVAPQLESLTLDLAVIDENGTVLVSGSYSDVGTLDTHTVTIDWGDGTTSAAAVKQTNNTFSVKHQYPDDNPTGTPSDDYTITATVTDDDGGSDSGSTTLTVENVAPIITGIDITSPIDENETATLTLAFKDSGPLDTFSLDVDWGDGSPVETFTYPAPTRSVSETHQYLDDGVSGTPSDALTVAVTLTDDDTGQDTATTAVVVNNVAPDITGLSLVLTSINENGVANLSGTFTDPGTLDTHAVTIDWGDGSATTTVTPATGAAAFTAQHQYLDDDPTGTPADTYTIGVTVTDDDTGSDTGSVGITVINVAPEITGLTLSLTTIDENGTTELSGVFTDPGTLDTHTITIGWGDGSAETVIDLTGGERSFARTHQYLDDDPTGTPSDVYTITVGIVDDDTGSDSDDIDVTVNNVAPDITSLSLSETVIDENDTVELSGAFTDPGTLDTHTITIAWGDGSADTIVDFTGGERSFARTHQYLDDDPTGTPSDVYTITVNVLDDDTGQDTETIDITVNNVAPVITSFETSAPGVGDADPDDTITVTGAFTDVGTLDTHTATIDWGDGSTTAAALVQGSGAGTISGSHMYDEAGIYTVTLTVVDDDTGVDTEVAWAVISGVAMHDGIIYAIGTDNDDRVTINQVNHKRVRVHTNFYLTGKPFRDFAVDEVQGIVVLCGAGDDHATIAGNVAFPILMDGGAGNDHLKGSEGPTVLLGAEGDDKLIGGRGRDILIGGTGRDDVIGGPDDDILIGGATAYDVDDDHMTADFADELNALRAEWSSSGDFETRVGHLTGDLPGGLNGPTLLTDATVFDDGVGDWLVGASGEDWLWEPETSVVGDFDGDGRPDHARKDVHGLWWVTTAAGSARAWALWSTTAGWHDVQAADIDGDGDDDIIGRTDSGTWWAAVATDGIGFLNEFVGAWASEVTWESVTVMDINGDGIDDVVGRVAETGAWWAAIGSGGFMGNRFLGGWSTHVTWCDVQAADVDGDGLDDIVGRTDTGQWWAGVSNGNGIANRYMGAWSAAVDWDNVSVSDVNGDGKADLLGRVAGTDTWWTGISDGRNFRNQLGKAHRPAAGWTRTYTIDVDGDGTEELVSLLFGTNARHLISLADVQ